MTTMMQRSLIILLAMLLSVGSVSAQKSTKTKKSKKPTTPSVTPTTAPTPAVEEKLDLNERPGALQAAPFVFPNFDEFKSKGTMNVYVVENHEQPIVTINLIMRAGDAFDPAGKEGLANFTSSMLLKGTATRTAQQIASQLDGVGSTISTSAKGEGMSISVTMLKKHVPTVLSILGDILTSPTFPDDEIEKMREQFLAGVAYERSRPSELAQALARKVIYGPNNSMARRESEESIKSITKEDMQRYRTRFMIPGNASIAFVGDVSQAMAKDWITKYFANWNGAESPMMVTPVMESLPSGVYFIPRPGSVQSSVIVTAPAPARAAADYESTSMFCNYMGGGFGSALFKTLRETHSYTYSPFGYITGARPYNRLAIGADVRTSVTDSAIRVILYEIAKVRTEGPDDEELARMINGEVGQYRAAFEDAGTVANVLQNAWISQRPVEDVVNFEEKIRATSPADVQQAASQYASMFALRICVVGDPSIKSKLEEFGKVSEWTIDVVPAVDAGYMETSMSVEDIVAKYTTAIGGADKIAALTTLVTTSKGALTMNGRSEPGQILRKQKAPNKDYQDMSFGFMKQTQWCDGSKVYASLSGGTAAELPGTDGAQVLAEAPIFPVLQWSAIGVKASVLGKKGDLIVVQVASPSGRTERFSFHATSFLLVQVERDQETPQGPLTLMEKYTDFVEVGGVMLPKRTLLSNPIYSMTLDNSYEANVALDDAVFHP